MSDRSVGSLESGPRSRDEPAQRRPRPRDGYLLPEDRADDELESVERAGHADPREASDEWRQLWIQGQILVDRHGWLRLPLRAVTAARLAGVAVLLGGVALIQVG